MRKHRRKMSEYLVQ